MLRQPRPDYSQYVRPLNWKHFAAPTAGRECGKAAFNTVLAGFLWGFETDGGEHKRLVSWSVTIFQTMRAPSSRQLSIRVDRRQIEAPSEYRLLS